MPIKVCSSWYPQIRRTFFCHPIYPSLDSWLKVKLTDGLQQNSWHLTCFLLYGVDRADPQMADSNKAGNRETRLTRTAKNCNMGTSHPITYYTHLLNIPKVFTVKQSQILLKDSVADYSVKVMLKQQQKTPTGCSLFDKNAKPNLLNKM